MSKGLHIFVYSASTVPNEFAHPIQILKTARALAARPGVKVTVYFVALGESSEEILRRYGLSPSPRLELKGLVPHWFYRLTGMDTHVDPERKRVYRRVRRRLARELMDSAARRPTMIYTRNQNMMALLREPAAEAGVPIYLELHWLKTLDRFRRRRERRAEKGKPRLGLAESKEQLRGEKAKERKSLMEAAGILCLTQQLRRTLEKWDLGRPLGWLPSGVDLNGSIASEASQETQIDILYLGQLYPWKGVDGLVEAMSHLPGRHLSIVGGNQAEDVARVVEAAERAGVGDRVHFLGPRPHTEVPGTIRTARVCVVPLPRAGFPEARSFTSPLKLFEFAACGKAIVASDLPSLREVLVHGENAWLTRPDDPKALAAGIRRVLEDEPLRRRLGAGALELAAEHDFARRAETILDFCKVPGYEPA